MTKFTPLGSTACVIALLSAGAAHADVTAEDVWANWQENFAMYGDDGVTIGDVSKDGDTLTVSSVSFRVDDNQTVFDMDMGAIAFVETGNGTVSVKLAESYPLKIETATGAEVNVSVLMTGMDLDVSGTPEAMIYNVSADKYGFIVDDIIENGKKIKSDVRFTLNNLAGAFTTTTGDMREIDYDMTAGSLDMLVDVTPPDTASDYFTLSGKIEDLATKASMVLPLAENMTKPEDMFSNGYRLDGGYTYGKGNYIFDVNAEGEQTSGSASVGSGHLKMTMDETAVRYDTLSQDIAVAMNGANIPFPIEISLAEAGLGFGMPLAKTDEPADFGLLVNFTDLNVNDTIWTLADPSGALPHDPVTILLDLSGKAKLFFDLLDPTQAEAIANAPVPGELNALTLNNLKISAAGAEVTGAGAFTFDNTDLTTFNGMPRPNGDVTVNVKGANALIDKLIAMGSLPEDQAMMGRMMMGMFATPTGDDELTSKIEVNDEGHLIANGQRLQ